MTLEKTMEDVSLRKNSSFRRRTTATHQISLKQNFHMIWTATTFFEQRAQGFR
jgi:hypothetical protein